MLSASRSALSQVLRSTFFRNFLIALLCGLDATIFREGHGGGDIALDLARCFRSRRT